MSNKQEGSNTLRRGLKARHMTMISLGGSIGTGLFLASGGAIHSAGPGGAVLAYALIGIMVYFLMTSLGEMATHMPVSGTFSTYATRFVDPSLGFALGWNYWYNWAITIAAELSAATLIMKFWFPNSPSILWSALFLLLMLGLNLLSVKGYGESEYWFAMIKIVTVYRVHWAWSHDGDRHLERTGRWHRQPDGESFSRRLSGDARRVHGGRLLVSRDGADRRNGRGERESARKYSPCDPLDFLAHSLVLYSRDLADRHADPIFERAAGKRRYFDEPVYDYFRESRD